MTKGISKLDAQKRKILELDPVWEVRPGGPLDKRVLSVDAVRLEPEPEGSPVAPDESLAEQAARQDIPLRAERIAGMDWATLAASVATCTACPLHETRTQAVFGVGDPRAEWLFVGEAPGAEEDKRGEPFVGRAGKLLDAMLAAMELRRGENVYIANVLKSRPPNNRDPLGEEVQQCEPYLKRQIALIKPKIIVALGRFAMQSLLRTHTPISQLRGQAHTYEGVPLVVTFHPAYLLRSPLEKRRAWQDLRMALQIFHDLKRGPK